MLKGMQVALQDNISTKGMETACGSKMLKDYIPVFNATVVERLEQAGMIISGKLAMDEFEMYACGSLETTAAVTLNPNPSSSIMIFWPITGIPFQKTWAFLDATPRRS